MINLLLNIPAATSPTEVVNVFDGYWDESDPPVWIAGAGYKCEVPPNGILPASKKGGGKAIVNCVVSGATYQQILDVTAAQRPVWQIFGAQNLNATPNPDYDPDIDPTIPNPDYDPQDPDSEPTLPNPDYEPPTITTVHKPVNNSVWNRLPDLPVYDNSEPPVQIGTEQQTELHVFQGSSRWPSR